MIPCQPSPTMATAGVGLSISEVGREVGRARRAGQHVYGQISRETRLTVISGLSVRG